MSELHPLMKVVERDNEYRKNGESSDVVSIPIFSHSFLIRFCNDSLVKSSCLIRLII